MAAKNSGGCRSFCAARSLEASGRCAVQLEVQQRATDTARRILRRREESRASGEAVSALVICHAALSAATMPFRPRHSAAPRAAAAKTRFFFF